MELRDVPTRALLLALLLSFWSSPVRAHDPSAWGGLFRSRDQGASWFLANPGWFVGGAIALAISPVDPNHLLLGTDSGLFRSRNGGRDWGREGTTLLVGPVFAVAFDANGQRALVSTGPGIFHTDDGNSWRKTPAPEGAAPARAIVRGSVAGRVYLAGRSGLLRSDDWGATWSSYAGGLPEGPVTAFLVVGGPPEIVYRIVGGRIWAHTDGAGVWVNRTAGAAVINVDALVVDQALPTRIWAAGAGQLFRSEDQGVRWRSVGRPLPERNTTVRGIAVAGGTIVLTTDRGLYRSADSGERWALLADNLPAHLEAGPLVRDPVDPDTLYAGFALTPYAEIWRRAAEGGDSLRRLSLPSLAGSAAFLALVALSAVVALRWLRHYYDVPSSQVPQRHGRGGRAAR